ncbi:MAG: hypothetical protein V9E89_16065 [Ilumatobacteraceae bacterium]
MSLASDRLAIGITRHFTAPGEHPYDQVAWERRDARISNYKDGSVAFEQLDVEFPVTWSLNATNIVAQKYFRGTLGTPQRETSLRQVIDRVADTITQWGVEGGYFAGTAETEAFRDELKYILVTQRAAFNSPVWFNIGVKGVPQQASACFILAVEDTMDGILNWYKEEGVIFKGGSGSGINLSNIRSSYELLNGGGTASGPVSFMRGADASAGTIKSGGKTRRAAKMVILNVDHPDVEEFIWCKVERGEEGPRVARRRLRHGPRRRRLVQHPIPERQQLGTRQRRVHAAPWSNDEDWTFRGRARRPAPFAPSRPVTCGARSPPRRGSAPTPACSSTPRSTVGTPPMRRDGSTGRTRAREYMHIDNSACNLASINLLKYLDEAKEFDVEAYMHTVEVDLHRPGDPRWTARTIPPRRSARTAASSASSVSATPTSAPC